MKKMVKFTLALIGASLFSTAIASVDKYDQKCIDASTDINARVSCLNKKGYNLIVITKKVAEGQSVKGKSWFKLYSIDGKDITPSLKEQDKYFKGSLPTYELVNKEIHQFTALGEWGEGDDEPEDMCLSAKTGKKVQCKY